MRASGALISIIATAGLVVAVAAAPLVSPRPMPRDARPVPAPFTSKVSVFYHATIRPRPRGQGQAVPVDPVTQVAKTIADEVQAARKASTALDSTALASTAPVFVSPRPIIRPVHLNTTPGRTPQRRRAPTQMASTAPTAISRMRSLCRDRGIRGERLAPIQGKLAGCFVPDPVRVTSIDGILLSQQSIMDCTTATTLAKWVRRSVKPAIRRRGGGLKSLSVPSHYSCRTRNSQPGAKLSEHAKGHAIDISAFNLKDGSRITVLDGWKNRRDHKLLKKLHDSACGPFGTVLGPEANRYHRDHFHFDTARYRGGPYCR